MRVVKLSLIAESLYGSYGLSDYIQKLCRLPILRYFDVQAGVTNERFDIWQCIFIEIPHG